MRFDLFVEVSVIFRKLVTHTKNHLLHFVHRYILHINNILLIPDLFVRPMMRPIIDFKTFYDV